MESLSSTSLITPPFHHHLRSTSTWLKPFRTNNRIGYRLKAFGTRGSGGDEEEEDEVDKALRLDGSIPGSSNEFVEQVSSRAYDMRRHLQQSFDSSSYDVLEANPWREDSKPVYVLTRRENQLCTMKTRMNRRCFSEDVRDGVLVFDTNGRQQVFTCCKEEVKVVKGLQRLKPHRKCFATTMIHRGGARFTPFTYESADSLCSNHIPVKITKNELKVNRSNWLYPKSILFLTDTPALF
ncbi:hypothetical protein Tco_1069833 [Tanacetum coccineum]|uniref:Uncharacterized protein n=1 Tax=Tanacetum coccineum TaxID=301880 RepID=A0ABQ5HJS3_9ASTR